ncbi:MAG: hypothetical protein ACK55Z_14515, partial [bacterium]
MLAMHSLGSTVLAWGLLADLLITFIFPCYLQADDAAVRSYARFSPRGALQDFGVIPPACKLKHWFFRPSTVTLHNAI